MVSYLSFLPLRLLWIVFDYKIRRWVINNCMFLVIDLFQGAVKKMTEGETCCWVCNDCQVFWHLIENCHNFDEIIFLNCFILKYPFYLLVQLWGNNILKLLIVHYPFYLVVQLWWDNIFELFRPTISMLFFITSWSGFEIF